MKYLKNWKVFEFINIKHEQTIYNEVCPTFDEKEFNSELLEKSLIEEIKWKLDDLSDHSEIEIGFMRTIPQFTPTRNIGCTDLMVISVKPIGTDWRKPNYLNSETLHETCKDISMTLNQFWDLETAICESYLPFSSIDEFFSTLYSSPTLMSKKIPSYTLRDITIIVYKQEVV